MSETRSQTASGGPPSRTSPASRWRRGLSREPEPGGIVELPTRYVGPVRLLVTRLFIALGVLALATLVVFVDRSGYRDSAGGPLSMLDCLYYSTVSLSTTGYGDIVPVSPGARLVSVIVVTPLRLVFLLVLVGTTLEVLTATARAQARSHRWRRSVRDHTIVVGYGSKGRSALQAMVDAGTPADRIVVIETDPDRVRQATDDGAAGVHGDATLTRVLQQAEVARAGRIIIATQRDDTSVLVTLTARNLCPSAIIVVAVREAENESLMMTAGATSVVLYAKSAGRLMGVSARSTASGLVADDLLSAGTGLQLIERVAGPDDVDASMPGGPEIVLAVVRDGRLYRYGETEIRIRPGDNLVVVRPTGVPEAG